ncbi:D-alanyl-lipoteichoic acid acyltransferase DltB, MBOAT superfamily [Dyadobacter soli]|uniref:D-alanyl-lipoteichoic acid acyltransferase DltB, MBOAT superfamily n=1 Tax=Dyadobacter soli TaxID=659014 RepID=A0A1G6UUT6_9BACT|nr:MBOAT family O-acyltransferase [Dyadobacter soli]SDD45051.1 D-alanyl-lipoteichoic acid acyltransferase DltB, MBOAT superfamily [Dyadobacter soli]
MVFNSYTFILFFVLLLGLHNLPFSWKTKKINLLGASYLFYALWNPPFILLLWLSTVVDFYMAKLISVTENQRRRQLWLAVSLVLNLGMLSYFKYGGFLLENFTMLMNSLGIAFQAAKPDIILPVGISFYTFVTLSYTIDVYRRKFKPESSFLDFALFVTYFPHLVAGPIVRPEDLIPQFKQPVKATSEQFTWGLFLLTLGLFLKVVIADGWLAETSDFIFSLPFPVNPLDAWSAVLAFSGQIFCDFSGYSTCAIGVSLCLGFQLPENFRYPYASVGFSDFWRRWHLTLSTWLRDYLYIPLGGNLAGRYRTYLNLMITMLLGGLWHGASWNFVIWGGLHGLFLCIERLLRRKPRQTQPAGQHEMVLQATVIPVRSSRLSTLLRVLLTFFLVNVTWVFFRSPDFNTALKMLLCMFGVIMQGPKMLSTPDMLKVAIVTICLLVTHWNMRERSVKGLFQSLPWWFSGTMWAVMLILIVLTQKSTGSFIYFQF